jgi:hypothetical protein
MRLLLTAVLAGAALSGCAAAELPFRTGGGGASPTVPRVVVTRDDPGLPRGCRPRALGGRIVEFLDAVNRGDAAGAASHADPARGWYSVSEGRRRHFVTTERGALAGYFARRHRRGERLRLLQLDVSFANGLGQVAYLLDRRADDLRRLGVRTTIAVGKGAVDCDTGEIVVWSTGMPVGTRGARERFGICPRPRSAAGAPVVCARRG